jgi:hypothetical protein
MDSIEKLKDSIEITVGTRESTAVLIEKTLTTDKSRNRLRGIVTGVLLPQKMFTFHFYNVSIMIV